MEINKNYTSPIVVHDLYKKYKKGNVLANNNISLQVNQGEILGLLGANGAGKTTLDRQITTEVIPTSGSIKVFGIDVVKNPTEAKSLMGILPQEQKPYDRYTVYHLMRIFGKMRGLSSADAKFRADELTDYLYLSEYRNTLVSNLSGGLRRRLLIGIASLAKPKLFLLDEPTTALDPKSRRDVWNILKDYKNQGSTLVLTTHYMEEAEALCDRVGIMRNGKLFAIDTVQNLKTRLGYKYKLSYRVNSTENIEKTIYGAEDSELLYKIRNMNVSNYAVSETTLEDVYLAITDSLLNPE